MPPAACWLENITYRIMDSKDALLKLQALCSKREYAPEDIYRKALKLLEDQEDPQGKAEALVEALRGDGFVDELRYSTAFAREKSALDGWGPLKIRKALILKNIDRDIIREALTEIDEQKAGEKLERALAYKWKNLKDDPQGRFKLLKFALGRGYEYEAIRDLVDRIVSTSD